MIELDAEIESHLNGIMGLQWKLSRYYLEPDINTYNIKKTKAKIYSLKYKIAKRINIMMQSNNKSYYAIAY